MSEVAKYNKIDGQMEVQYLKGVGPARAKIFAQHGVETVADLLEYFPRDYNFLSVPVKLHDIEPNQEVTAIGLVEATDFSGYGRRQKFEVMLTDETDMLRLVWFNGGYLRDKINVGQTLIVVGKTKAYKHQLQMANPKFMIVDSDSGNPEEHFGGGIYPASAGLTSQQIKRIIKPVLEHVPELINELFDEKLRAKAELIERAKAFSWIHSPDDEESIKKAKRRLKYDELFLMQLGLALRRYRAQHLAQAVSLQCRDEIDHRIRKRFPFLLTEDQDNSINEIAADLNKNIPMNRLLQGDVGSGKTVVALYAALLAVANKQQVAIMAPTEILATQHFLSIERYLKDSKVRRELVTGSVTGEARKQIHDKIQQGKVDIVIGTVALLNKEIDFKSLGLVIIDEQHKFGVHQRAQ